MVLLLHTGTGACLLYTGVCLLYTGVCSKTNAHVQISYDLYKSMHPHFTCVK